MVASIVESWLSSDAGGLVWALVDASVKGALVLAAAGVLTVCLKRASAAVRHVVWFLGLASLIALPLLSLALPAWQLPILPGRLAPAEASAEWVAVEAAPAVIGDVALSAIQPPGAATMPELASPVEAHAELTSLERPEQPVHWSAWVLAVWLAGALVVLSPLGVGTVCVWRIARRARPVGDGSPWAGARDGTGRRGAALRLRESDRVAVPMMCGLFRPVVLVPAGATDWSEERRRAVVAHELAHLERRDCWTQTLVQLACALHWFNPLAWLAARRMRIERERACDDRVLGAGLRPSDYAGHLLEIARSLRGLRCGAIGVVPMAHRSQLEGRLLAILDAKRSRRTLTGLTLAVALVVLSCIILPLGALRPVAKAAEPAESAEQVWHVVRTGETLTGISERYYSTPAHWRTIFEANKDLLSNPALMRPGMKLRIPPEPAVAKTEEAAQGEAAEHTVESKVLREEFRHVLADVVAAIQAEGHRLPDELRQPNSEAKLEDDLRKLGVMRVTSEQEKAFAAGRFKDEQNARRFKDALDECEDMHAQLSFPCQIILASLVDSSELKGARLELARRVFEAHLPKAASILAAEGTDGGFAATLPSSVTVELVGVSYHPSEGKEWWRPDGSPLDTAPYDSLSVRAHGEKAWEFAVQMSGFSDGIPSARWQLEPTAVSSGGDGSPEKDGRDLIGLRAIAASIPDASGSCNLRFGAGGGPWVTVADSGGIRPVAISGEMGNVIFTEPHQGEGGVRISVSNDLPYGDRRVVALDKDGQTHEASRTQLSSAGDLQSVTGEFPALTLEQIAGFQLQTRPFEWVEFRNVSLEPGHRTDVQVVVEPEKGELTFGPVIERVVDDDGVGRDCFVDFDTGKLLTPPSELRQASEEALMDWLRKSGIDAMGETKSSFRGLAGFDMIALPVANARWQSAPSDVARDLVIGVPGTPAVMSAKGELPATFYFKTREGGMGILQIVGFTEDPRGVKIRYKMVQSR